MNAASIHIGTSGWHYDHWKGPFYSEDMPASGFLERYAECFRETRCWKVRDMAGERSVQTHIAADGMEAVLRSVRRNRRARATRRRDLQAVR